MIWVAPMELGGAFRFAFPRLKPRVMIWVAPMELWGAFRFAFPRLKPRVMIWVAPMELWGGLIRWASHHFPLPHCFASRG